MQPSRLRGIRLKSIGARFLLNSSFTLFCIFTTLKASLTLTAWVWASTEIKSEEGLCTRYCVRIREEPERGSWSSWTLSLEACHNCGNPFCLATFEYSPYDFASSSVALIRVFPTPKLLAHLRPQIFLLACPEVTGLAPCLIRWKPCNINCWLSYSKYPPDPSYEKGIDRFLGHFEIASREIGRASCRERVFLSV